MDGAREGLDRLEKTGFALEPRAHFAPLLPAAGTVGVMERDSRVVYSSADGDLRKGRDPQLKRRQAGGDGVKVRREVAGRRGKAVTTVSGVPVDDARLKALARRLKKRCGVGGSVKDGVIEIQGDHRDAVVEVLKDEGYTPVLAGG